MTVPACTAAENDARTVTGSCPRTQTVPVVMMRSRRLFQLAGRRVSGHAPSACGVGAAANGFPVPHRPRNSSSARPASVSATRLATVLWLGETMKTLIALIAIAMSVASCASVSNSGKEAFAGTFRFAMTNVCDDVVLLFGPSEEDLNEFGARFSPASTNTVERGRWPIGTWIRSTGWQETPHGAEQTRWSVVFCADGRAIYRCENYCRRYALDGRTVLPDETPVHFIRVEGTWKMMDGHNGAFKCATFEVGVPNQAAQVTSPKGVEPGR